MWNANALDVLVDRKGKIDTWKKLFVLISENDENLVVCSRGGGSTTTSGFPQFPQFPPMGISSLDGVDVVLSIPLGSIKEVAECGSRLHGGHCMLVKHTGSEVLHVKLQDDAQLRTVIDLILARRRQVVRQARDADLDAAIFGGASGGYINEAALNNAPIRARFAAHYPVVLIPGMGDFFFCFSSSLSLLTPQG